LVLSTDISVIKVTLTLGTGHALAHNT